jgi:hypothetical protein
MLNEIDSLIKDDFNETRQRVIRIIHNSAKPDQATREIMDYLSKKLPRSCSDYGTLLYSVKSGKTLSEDAFRPAENANKFYRLDLLQKLSDAYGFNMSELNSIKTGIDLRGINKRCGPTAVKAAVGSGVLTGVVLGLLSSPLRIPIAVVIAGALIAGLGGGYAANKLVVPQQNKRMAEESVQKFLSDLESDVRSWADGLERYYDDQVSTLRKELEESKTRQG